MNNTLEKHEIEILVRLVGHHIDTYDMTKEQNKMLDKMYEKLVNLAETHGISYNRINSAYETSINNLYQGRAMVKVF